MYLDLILTASGSGQCTHLERSHSFDIDEITWTSCLIIREVTIHFVSCILFAELLGKTQYLPETR